jgi:hypothetical protein
MILTEKKRIKVDTTCKDFPMYLCWLNSLGGYSYWLFFKTHTETSKTKAQTGYSLNEADLATDIGTNDIVGKSAVHSFRIGARMLSEDMDGITGLFESPKVMLLMNPETWQTDSPTGTPLPRWQRTLVGTGSLVILKTSTAFLEVKLDIQMPRINTQKE